MLTANEKYANLQVCKSGAHLPVYFVAPCPCANHTLDKEIIFIISPNHSFQSQAFQNYII